VNSQPMQVQAGCLHWWLCWSQLLLPPRCLWLPRLVVLLWVQDLGVAVRKHLRLCHCLLQLLQTHLLPPRLLLLVLAAPQMLTCH
jgi:hypothetical protein